MLVALLLATIVVAFIAGIVALAMPCCFTVLLPAYLAKSFDSVAGRVGMTGVFGLGIATILLPIALGVSELTDFLSLNHALLFVVGGFFMIVLGLLAWWGLPMFSMGNWRGVDLQRKDVPSVYALGVFSGVASSCCAPVLAGVLVLTVISGGLIPSLFVGLAYVAGMVFPLLVVATFWDRRTRQVPGFLRGRMLTLRLPRGSVDIHSSKLLAGALFVGMGAVTIALGLTDHMLVVPGSSLFGIYQGTLEQFLLIAFGNPGIIAVIVAIIGFAAGYTAYSRLRRHRAPVVPPEAEGVEESDERTDVGATGSVDP